MDGKNKICKNEILNYEKNLLPNDFPMVLLDVFFVLGDIGPDDGGDVEGGRLNRPGSIQVLGFADDPEDRMGTKDKEKLKIYYLNPRKLSLHIVKIYLKYEWN